MKTLQINIIIFMLLTTLIGIDCGFFYGEPCSPRNTLYISNFSNYHNHAPPKCVQLEISPRGIHMRSLQPLLRAATELHADNLHLTHLPMNFIKCMPSVMLINVAENNIRKIPIYALSNAFNLVTLVLKRNELRVYKDTPFIHSTSLTTLQLSDNMIRHVQKVTFALVPNLVYLYLDGNRLRTLMADTFDHLTSLQYLNVDRNPILLSMVVLPPNLKLIVIYAQTFQYHEYYDYMRGLIK